MFSDIKLIPKIIFQPQKFFRDLGEQPTGELYKFWVQLCLLNFLISFLLSLLNLNPLSSQMGKLLSTIGFSFSPTRATIVFLFIVYSFVFIVMITFGFLLIMFGTLFIHLFVKIFGGKGYNGTLTAVIISSTPSLILGPIPIVQYFTSVYTLILQVIGISKIHKISTFKAILSVILPIVILVIIIWVLVAVLFLSILGALNRFA